MLRLAALTLALPVALALPGARTYPACSQTAAASELALLPDPTARVTIDPEAPNALGDALREVAASAGVHLLISDDVRATLAKGSELLESPVELAPETAWLFLETILIENELLMVLNRRAGPRLVTIASREPGRTFKLSPLWIEEEELHLAEQHPALHVSTLVEAPHLDTFKLVSDLRFLMQGDWIIQRILPAGDSRSIVLTGLGGDVGKFAKLIAEMDAAEAKRIATQDRDGRGARGGE